MKYILSFIFVGIFRILWVSLAQLDYPFNDDSTIITDDVSFVVGQAPLDGWEPFREGATAIAEGLGWEDEWIYFDEIDSTQTARDRTSTLISTIVNYALAIIGLVALVYLLYHGFLALTAWSNSEQLTKWIQWVKYAGIALAGIWVAWFVISLILRFITLVTT